MRIASFNVENMFSRPVALNQQTWSARRDVLEAFSRANTTISKTTYSAADKKRLAADLITLGLALSDSGGMALLRQVRGKLVKRAASGLQIVATGRGDWIGWIELATEAVDELATRHTALVIGDVNADILAVVEAENRTTLRRFNEAVLQPTTSLRYKHVMCIDGNDERGIDVGIYTKADYRISSIATHIDDEDTAGTIFSRDCAEYTVTTPSGESVLVMVNHFKSKGYGSPATSNAKRLRQAQRVADIYRQRLAEGRELIAVVGDLNDTPVSSPLAPLITGTTLKDVSAFVPFDDGGYPGTYGTGNATSKIDFLLVSPKLFGAISSAGVYRKGCYTASGRWPMYPTLTKAEQAASDHAAIWADFAL
jgi:endonuclease/exonuclease/phosphatase family metal-dependent hydrolase